MQRNSSSDGGPPWRPLVPAHRGWTKGSTFRNGETLYGIALPLGPPYAGPLFLSQLSFLGLDPRGVAPCYADYWRQNCAHTLINRAHYMANPHGFADYGELVGAHRQQRRCRLWHLLPAQRPRRHRPTAALSAMLYTPRESMAALRLLYEDLDREIWGRTGFADALNLSRRWFAPGNLAID